MVHFERRLGAGWSTDQKPVGFLAFHLTLHPFRVEMRVSALAMLIPGHNLKRLKPISHPYGDVLLAKYRECARGQVLEHQRVTNHRQKSQKLQTQVGRFGYIYSSRPPRSSPRAYLMADALILLNRQS